MPDESYVLPFPNGLSVENILKKARADYTRAQIDELLAAKQAMLTPAQQSAVDSGINSTKVSQIDTNTAAIANKQDKLSSDQLAAVNSGVDSDDVTQIETNTNAITALQQSFEGLVYGYSLTAAIDSSYKITVTLKDQSGNVLSTTPAIDLPLETMVVGGSYDNTNKKIILILDNGNTVDIPVGDLVSGLQTEITSSNKLSSDLVNDNNNSNKFVSSTQKTKIDDSIDTAGSGLTVENGTGLHKSLKHTDSITAKTSVELLKIKFNSTGHITGVETATMSDMLMTGYTKSSSNDPLPIATTDSASEAIGKLEQQAGLNKNNILSIYNTGFAQKNVMRIVLDEVKALLPSQSFVGNTTTFGNLSVTFNEDNSITLNGSHKYDVAINFKGLSHINIPTNAVGAASANITLSNVIFFGLWGDSGVSNLLLNNGVDIPSDYASKYSRGFVIRVSANTVCNNVRIYPMVCDKALYQASSEVVPYAMSNAELTAEEQVNKNNILSIQDHYKYDDRQLYVQEAIPTENITIGSTWIDKKTISSYSDSTNIAGGVIEQGSWNINGLIKENTNLRCRLSNSIILLPSTTYTITLDSPTINDARVLLQYRNINDHVGGESGWQSDLPYTFTTPANCRKVTIIFSNSADSNCVPSDFGNLQINKGSTAQTYESPTWS